MQKIHWGFMIGGIITGLMFLIVFFQNFNPFFFAYWAFLVYPNLGTTSAWVVLIGFLGGFLTATFFFMAVKGGRYDPSPTVQGKESPDSWERVADQY